MSSSDAERRFAQEATGALIEICFFDPKTRGILDRENQARLAFEGMTLTIEEGRIVFSLAVRERDGRQRAGVADFTVTVPVSEYERDHAREVVENWVVELNEDLMSQAGASGNPLRWR